MIAFCPELSAIQKGSHTFNKLPKQFLLFMAALHINVFLIRIKVSLDGNSNKYRGNCTAGNKEELGHKTMQCYNGLGSQPLR